MDIFKILGKIAVDTKDAEKGIDDTTKKAENAQGKMSKAFSGISQFAGKMAIGIGAAGTAIGGAMVGLAESTREYRTEMGKLDTAFQTQGHSSEVAKKTYSDLNAVLGDTGQAVEAANHLALLTDNEKELKTWTDICTGVYATFGASLPIEGLTEAANETAKVGTVTGSLADALNWAGISEDEFNQKLALCRTEQGRQKLIMDTLTAAYQDASTQYKKTNADVMAHHKAQERLSNAMAKVGEVCEPILTMMTNGIATLAEMAVPALENVQTGFDKVSEMVKKTSEKLKEADEWVKKHETGLQLLAIGVGTLTTAVIAYNIAQGIQNAGGITAVATLAAQKVATVALTVAQKAQTVATTVATGATTAFSTAMAFLTSPITLVIAAIGALVAIGVVLYKNWDTIKAKASSMIEAVSTKFEGFKKSLKAIADAVKDYFDFEFKMPKIKLPHFSITPSGWEIGDLLEGKIPKLGVEWYAKGGVLTKPTIFGVNDGKVMAGGEAGDEAVAPIDVLQGYVAEAVASQNVGMIEVLYKILEAILDMDEAMGEKMKQAISDMSVKLDNREIGRVVRTYA